MDCIKCNSSQVRVIDTRAKGTRRIYRRRVCMMCGFRWTTVELPLVMCARRWMPSTDWRSAVAKSILQSDKECYLCRKRYNLRTTRGLEEHHILFGRGRRELSERYGLKVWLCHDHHNEPPLGVHFDPGARRELEQAAQFAFDNIHGPGSFAEVFGEEI